MTMLGYGLSLEAREGWELASEAVVVVADVEESAVAGRVGSAVFTFCNERDSQPPLLPMSTRLSSW